MILTAQHLRLARQFARRYGSFSDPEEAYSLALSAIWQASLTWVDGKGCTFASWAQWYARRALSRQRKRQATHWGRIAGVDPEWLGVDAAEPVDNHVALHEAIAKLPKSQREAVELVWLQGRSQAEVAAQFATTRQAVATRIETALKKLKRTLQSSGAAPF